MGKLNWHFKGCDGSRRTMQVSKIYGSHGDNEREGEPVRETLTETERERAKKSAVYSDALTRFYVPLGRNGIHIVAVVRLILEAVT